MNNKLLLTVLSIVLLTMLAACSTNEKNTGKGSEVTNNTQTNEQVTEVEEIDDGEHANHTTTTNIPEGLKEAENPKFPVGSKAIINASHTDGMEGAEATIVAAYDGPVYSVSYTPTNGEPFEENHKWFVDGELKGVDDATLNPGTEVIINVEHTPGMKGALGTIDTAEETTVYVVDYTNSLGETVKYHLWLKESELISK